MAGDKPIRWGDAKMTREQVAQVLYNAGFRGQDLINFVGIAFRESGGHPNLYVERPSTGDWSYGLFGLNIGRNNSLWPAYQQMGFTNPEQLATADGGARAAYLLFQKMGYYPWGGYKGMSGTYGTNLTAAKAAVENATAQGLLGQAYTGPGQTMYGTNQTWNGQTSASSYSPSASSSDSTTAIQARPDPMNAAEERSAFDAYLKTLPPDQQTQIINSLKQPRDLAGLASYMSTSPEEVNRYIRFLSTLDTSGQNAEKNMLAAPDIAGSQEMTDVLRTLGVSYPNAPNPTPALLAFLRGVGLNLSTAEDVKNRALERIGAATSDAMADIDRTAGRTKQNITADLVRRNVLSSGESNTRYARQAEDVAAQQSDVQRTSTTSTEGVNETYRQAQDLARQQALDRVISAEQDQATQKATAAASEDAFRRQQEAADKAWQQQFTAQQDASKKQIEAIQAAAAQGVAV